MKIIRNIVAVCGVALTLGCVASPPTVMVRDFQSKVITPCDNDALCLQSEYSVTWDSWCNRIGYKELSGGCGLYSGQWPSYPVTYRAKDYIFKTGDSGYIITLPEGGVVRWHSDNSSN
jgi:hypothetical protein